jgi:hypothetical protein
MVFGIGLVIARGCYYYYSETVKSFWPPPVWKSAIILTLITASVLVPAFTAFRFLA